MEASERLERIGRTKDITEIAEHLAWLKEEGINGEKKAVFDREIADGVWRALQEDVNKLLAFAAASPSIAICQHARRIRYYEKIEKLAKEVFGKGSPSADAAKKAKSIYAGRILGVGLLSFVKLSPTDIARLIRVTKIVEQYEPSTFSTHSVIKGAYVFQHLRGKNGAAALAIQAAGLEAKALRIPPSTLMMIDKSIDPRGFNIREVARERVPRYYRSKVRSVEKHTVKETAYNAVRTAEDIRRSSAVLENVLGKEPKNWATNALNMLYKKLVAIAKIAVESGNEEEAKKLLHAAAKVRGLHVRVH